MQKVKYCGYFSAHGLMLGFCPADIDDTYSGSFFEPLAEHLAIEHNALGRGGIYGQSHKPRLAQYHDTAADTYEEGVTVIGNEYRREVFDHNGTALCRSVFD